MALLPNSGLETHPSGVPSLNALINGNWNVLDSWANPASGLTAAQAGATVTASAVIFTSQNVGDKIRFASGEECTITATSGTVATPSATCTVTPSRTVASAAINLFAPTTQSAKTFFARAFTKKTKASDIPAGATLIWNATKQIFEPGGTESSPLLYMNVRNSGTNAILTNSAAIGYIHGRNTNTTTILANTVLPNSHIKFEWIGSIARASLGIAFYVNFGPLTWSIPAFVPPALGLVRFYGEMRFSGASATSAVNGRPICDLWPDIGSFQTPSVCGFTVPGGTVDLTVNQEFSIQAQWQTANVGNSINVETFSLRQNTNAN